jgi:hypothetical protein
MPILTDCPECQRIELEEQGIDPVYEAFRADIGGDETAK